MMDPFKQKGRDQINNIQGTCGDIYRIASYSPFSVCENAGNVSAHEMHREPVDY